MATPFSRTALRTLATETPMTTFRAALTVGLLTGLVVLAALAAAPGAATTVERHGLASATSADRPSGNGTVFTPDDRVFAWMYADEPLAWNETRWVFDGPGGVTYATNGSGDQRGGHHYGTLDLRGYDPDAVVGEWTVTAYVRGEEMYTDAFTVERAHPWWLRAGSVAAAVALVLVVAGFALSRWRGA